jgi:hypothetical protein
MFKPLSNIRPEELLSEYGTTPRPKTKPIAKPSEKPNNRAAYAEHANAAISNRKRKEMEPLLHETNTVDDKQLKPVEAVGPTTNQPTDVGLTPPTKRTWGGDLMRTGGLAGAGVLAGGAGLAALGVGGAMALHRATQDPDEPDRELGQRMRTENADFLHQMHDIELQRQRGQLQSQISPALYGRQ